MKLLDFDPETNGKTWLNPRRLDRQIPNSEYRGASFVISGRFLIATTGPVMDHIELLMQAWLIHGDDQLAQDTPIFEARCFDVSAIGLLRGNAGASGAAIEFDVPRDLRLEETAEGLVPVVDVRRLDLVLEYTRSHAAFRSALPKVPVCIRLRNYVDAVGHGGWLYDGAALRAYESELAYLQMLGQT